MATGIPGDGLFYGISFDGCISGTDTGVQSRPYHRNCSCALHEPRGRCHHTSRRKSIAYPIRRSWSESCLALVGQQYSPSSSPVAAGVVVEMTRTPSQLGLNEEEDAVEGGWPKV